MGCFLVPAAEAIVTTAATKIVVKKEIETEIPEMKVRIPFSRKMKWLSNLLWGGSALLAFEHVWHGEVVPWFPFLTAAQEQQTLVEMLREMATAGTCMTLLVTGVWGLMLLAVSRIERKEVKVR